MKHCETQIAFIFENMFKAASLICYIIVTVTILELLNKQPPYLIKIFLKLPNHLNKLLHLIERTKMTYFLKENER